MRQGKYDAAGEETEQEAASDEEQEGRVVGRSKADEAAAANYEEQEGCSSRISDLVPRSSSIRFFCRFFGHEGSRLVGM